MGDSDDKSRKNHYGLEGRKRQIQENVWDIGMCFDKREKGTWLFHICKTPCKVPWFYLAGCCFPCCVAFYQRQLLLHDKMYEEYEFCQGKYGRFWCPSLAKKIPYCCLCLESFCCVGCAIGGNRVLMNERYMIADTLSETIILLVAAILSFFGLFGAILGCWVNGVLNGQQENEITDKEGGTGLIPYFRWKVKDGGDERNNIWDLNKCEPCCGEPCNVLDALKCFVWWCCPCCSMCTAAKFFASSLGKECNLMEHCVPYLVAYLCQVFNPIPICNLIPCWLLTTGTRHNTRISTGTGKDKHYFGDCLIGNCCLTAPCALCQELRSQPKESWDWVKQMQEKGFPETGNFSEFKLFSNCNGILD